MKTIANLAISTFVAIAAPAFAQATAHDAHRAAAPAAADAALTQGEVKKIDKDAGKITLKHGRIENLDMPGMTMVFRAKDRSALEGLKVGDSVLFKAESVGGSLVVTELRKSS